MVNDVLHGDYSRLMYRWVDYIIVQNNNKNVYAASVELTGVKNKLTTQPMDKQPTLLKVFGLHCQAQGIWKSKWGWNSNMFFVKLAMITKLCVDCIKKRLCQQSSDMNLTGLKRQGLFMQWCICSQI